MFYLHLCQELVVCLLEALIENSLMYCQDVVSGWVFCELNQVLDRALLCPRCLSKEAQPGHHCKPPILQLLDFQILK